LLLYLLPKAEQILKGLAFLITLELGFETGDYSGLYEVEKVIGVIWLFFQVEAGSPFGELVARDCH
jgi:hypothetical protein